MRRPVLLAISITAVFTQRDNFEYGDLFTEVDCTVPRPILQFSRILQLHQARQRSPRSENHDLCL